MGRGGGSSSVRDYETAKSRGDTAAMKAARETFARANNANSSATRGSYDSSGRWTPTSGLAGLSNVPTADLMSGNFDKNYITGNSLWVDPRVNNAQRGMIQSNFYADQGGNVDPYSQQQITDASKGGHVGSSYSTGRDTYTYVSPYMTGGQNFISPTQRTDQMGNTVRYRGNANEPRFGAYASGGVQKPQDMNYSWERTGGTSDLRDGTYKFNPAGAQQAAPKDITVAAIKNAISRAKTATTGGAGQQGQTISLRDYMSNLGMAPNWNEKTGMITIGGTAYNIGNIPGTRFDPATGTHYVIDPGAVNSLFGADDNQALLQQTPSNPANPDYQPTPTMDFNAAQSYQGDNDTTDYINQLAQAQKASRFAALDKAKATALSGLDTEKANVSPAYYDKRNQAAAASDVGAMNFAQYMAARGIKGAAGAMPEIYRNAGLQGEIGALDRAETSDLSAIERQRANVETGYAYDTAAANADVETQAMQSLVDQWNADRAYALQQAQLTGNMGNTRTLAGQEFDWSRSPSNPDYQHQLLTNERATLENAYQEIANSYAPETLKLQAQRLKQQVEVGALDFATAQAQIDQIKAQTKNYLRDANEPYKTSGKGGGKAKPPTVTEKATSYIQSNMTKFRSPNDMYQQVIRNIKAGGLDYSTGNAVLNQLKTLYPDDIG